MLFRSLVNGLRELDERVATLERRFDALGERRVAIARAVIARPRLLLADEPTGNVDDRMAMRLLHLFEELNKLGTTIVIATHNETLVDKLKHPCLRLDEGRISMRPGRVIDAATDMSAAGRRRDESDESGEARRKSGKVA